MKIRLTKSGKWALGGVKLVELEKDQVVNFGPKNNNELVMHGWAVPEQVHEPKEAPKEMPEEEDPQGVSVEKGDRGWWTVSFGDADPVKVRAKNEKEAIELAQEKMGE